mmetsp:Transcript_28871/g.42781  ORF Transcript_28871/g.42781 Transcript_28871/m.42781 type:complete len:475 (-) Transcript_28871:127-1551(-)|eukprot:CAMPEP_0195526546 /NCGR_PEP_ID=MMETSP0794_2-20130614/27681_1 /TAXON_ID=515487 /ORGANISM="Stephanopyxis turris, Strain CCMP 815" /LENGTH=474 /DNA_ID=CAMNT_0040657265 /DNA_START=190 /DNA_END=1614 /DNA_ORIENTATION=-
MPSASTIEDKAEHAMSSEDAVIAEHDGVSTSKTMPHGDAAGKTLLEIFGTYGASAVIGDRIIRGQRALRSPQRLGSNAAEDEAVAGSTARPSNAGKSFQIDIEQVQGVIARWDFDAFNFANTALAQESPLAVVAMAALHHPEYRIFDSHSIDKKKLQSFLVDAENSYFGFAYHNRIHACDTVQAVHFLMTECGVHSAGHFGPLDTLALVLSTAIHDVGHPGLNNGYHVATRDSLAISFHDVSVLENYHAGIGLQLLSRPRNNFLTDLFPAPRTGQNNKLVAFRRSMVELVLATDLSRHKDIVAEFKSLCATECSSSAAAGAASPNNRKPVCKQGTESQMKLMTMKMAIKAADISHPTRSFATHCKFSKAIQQEFFEQGDIERTRGMKISFLCDRSTATLPGSQIGFLKFMIMPFFSELANHLARHGESRAKALLVSNAEANLAEWERLKRVEDEDAAANAADADNSATEASAAP